MEQCTVTYPAEGQTQPENKIYFVSEHPEEKSFYEEWGMNFADLDSVVTGEVMVGYLDHVCLVPDTSDTSVAHMREAARKLVGTVASVRLFDFRDRVPDWKVDFSLSELPGGLQESVLHELLEHHMDLPVYTPPAVEPANPDACLPDHTTGLVRSADVALKPLNWLWEPYLPEGKVSLILGEAGSGKTYFALKLAALISTGRPFFTESPLITHTPGPVFYLSGEDGAGDTLKARLAAMGADEEQIYFIDDAHFGTRLTFNSPELHQWIEMIRPRVIIFDPIQGFLDSGVDINNQIQVRQVLIDLKRLAECYDFTPLCIVHPNKDARMKANDRVSGSKDFVNLARSVLVIGQNGDAQILMAHTKSNLAPKGATLAFQLETLTDAEGHQVSGDLICCGESAETADTILSGTAQQHKALTKLEQAEKLLRRQFTEGGGKLLVAPLKARAEAMGIAYNTLCRARDALGAAAIRGDGGQWYWQQGENIA